MSFNAPKYFNFDKVQFVYFVVVAHACGHIQVPTVKSKVMKINPICPAKCLAVIYKAFTHFGFISVYSVGLGQFHFFVCKNLAVLETFVNEILFFFLYSMYMAPCQKNPTIGYRYIGLFLGSLDRYRCMPIPHYCGYCSFIVNFEIGEYESSNFVLFKIVFWLFGDSCNSM